MQRVLLLIQDAGHDPIAGIHPNEDAARLALASYVRERTGMPTALHADNDDGAIEAYFAGDIANYFIVGLAVENR